MKLTTLTALAIAFGLPAFADGPSQPRLDPEVRPLARPASPIVGPYAGIMATKTETTQTTETSSIACEIPEVTPTPVGPIRVIDKRLSMDISQCEEAVTTSVRSILSEETGAAAFAGYRHALGPVILGAEISGDGDLTTLSGQAGLALGRNLLAYGFAGGGDLNGDQGAVYGAGLDYVSESGWLIGASAMRSDDLDLTQIGLRLGYSF